MNRQKAQFYGYRTGFTGVKMDIDKLIHDEIMAHRNMAIDHPDLLQWSQDRIDALYQIKRAIDHYQSLPPVNPHLDALRQ